MATTLFDFDTLSEGRKKYIEKRAKKMGTDIAGYFAEQELQQDKLDVQEEYNVEPAFFDKMKAYTGNDMTLPAFEEQIYSQQFMCYDNAQRYAEQEGGKVVYGWMLMPNISSECKAYKHCGIVELHHHALVERDNMYICVTPYGSDPSTSSIGVFGGDLDFQRHFWRDDRFTQETRPDNIIYLPNTKVASDYQKRSHDLKHIKLGVLGHLDPNQYPEYSRPTKLSEIRNNPFGIETKMFTADETDKVLAEIVADVEKEEA